MLTLARWLNCATKAALCPPLFGRHQFGLYAWEGYSRSIYRRGSVFLGIVVDGVPSIGQALSGPPLAMDLEYNLYLHIMHIHFIMATLPRSNRCLWVAILITVHGTYGKALY